MTPEGVFHLAKAGIQDSRVNPKPGASMKTMDSGGRFINRLKQIVSLSGCLWLLAPLVLLGGCAQEGYKVTGLDPKGSDAAYTQSETAVAVSFSNGQTILSVAYNDDTGTDATIQYTPTDRLVLPGANNMGGPSLDKHGDILVP